jgi:predicted nucleic acid-binding protein
VASLLYKKPYIDSDVFIGVIKNEVIPETVDGKVVNMERGKIGAHVLTLAEQRVFPVYISPLTIAEVHKIRHQEKLTDDENENVLEFFENDFVTVVPIDREDGEEANRLCRKYQAEKLSPTDALHLACALKAECDVLLTWDGDFAKVAHPDIQIKRPTIWNPPKQAEQADLLFVEVVNAEAVAAEVAPAEAVAQVNADEVQAKDEQGNEGNEGHE